MEHDCSLLEASMKLCTMVLDHKRFKKLMRPKLKFHLEWYFADQIIFNEVRRFGHLCLDINIL